jgi:threonine dehydrogenase-like Zn-dependent dehydrogenase
VAVEPLHGCIEMGKTPPCSACQAGHYELCEHHLVHVGIPLVEMLPGGYGEYSIVHASKAYKMPEGVSFEDAALLDVLAVGVHAAGIGKPIPGMSCAVLGSGVIGIDLIQCLRAWGVRKIIATAKYPFQAEAAKTAGASDVILLEKGVAPVERVLELNGGAGVDQVYEGVGGKTDVINEAVRMCRRGGTIVMTGIFDGERPVDLLTMLFASVSILSSNSYSITGLKPDYEIALDLLASGQAKHDFVVTHRFAPEDFQKAIDTAFDKKGNQCLRAMFIRDA